MGAMSKLQKWSVVIAFFSVAIQVIYKFFVA